VHHSCRSALAVLVAVVSLVPPALAFNTPLSPEAVRDAYFLGQRHDGTFGSLFGKYIRLLPPPENGPYISSVAFLTPFIQLVQASDHYIGNYSAQQADLDYREQEEFVRVVVQIQLTNSYAAWMKDSSRGSTTLVPRPHDFWKDFRVQVFDGATLLSPLESRGHSNYNCGRRGPCTLTGATLEFDLPADAFRSGAATIKVTPPEGDPISVAFDLDQLR
jgi:hypothetical protein